MSNVPAERHKWTLRDWDESQPAHLHPLTVHLVGTSVTVDGPPRSSLVSLEVHEGRLRVLVWHRAESDEPTILDLEEAYQAQLRLEET